MFIFDILKAIFCGNSDGYDDDFFDYDSGRDYQSDEYSKAYMEAQEEIERYREEAQDELTREYYYSQYRR